MNTIYTMLIACCPISLNLHDLYYRDQPAIELPKGDDFGGDIFQGSVFLPGKHCLTIRELKGDRILTFPYVKCLTQGIPAPKAIDSEAYLPIDLQPGDQIVLYVEQIGRKSIITRIQLKARQDGSAIPASQNPDPKKPYHIWQSAVNNWNHKGVAIPNNILKQYGQTKHPPPPLWMKEGKPAPFK
jgi:hypothetical protein